MSDPRFDAIQLGVHAKERLRQRAISTQDIEYILGQPARQYPGMSAGTTTVEGQTVDGRLLAVVYSELADSRGRVAYIVTVYPIRRFRDDAADV